IQTGLGILSDALIVEESEIVFQTARLKLLITLTEFESLFATYSRVPSANAVTETGFDPTATLVTFLNAGEVGSALITLTVFDPGLVTTTRWFLASNTA